MDRINKRHFDFFKEALIKNGATKDITDKQVMASCGYEDSLRSFGAGWDAMEKELTVAVLGNMVNG